MALQAGIYGTLKGKITDEKGEGLIGASVEIIGKGMGAMADINGNYRITNISPGKYEVKFSMLNFTPQIVNLEIFVDQIRTYDVQLSQNTSGDTTAEITVIADAIVDQSAQGSQTTMTSDMMEVIPREGIAGVIGMTAGVSGSNIRGSRTSETQIRLDGLMWAASLQAAGVHWGQVISRW